MEGNLVASGSLDKTVQVWNMRIKQKLWQFHHDDVVRCVQLHDKYLITCCKDKLTRIWDIETGKVIHKLDHPGKCYNCDLSPNKTLLAVASHTAVVLWDFKNATKIKEFKLGKYINDVKFNRDGTRLVAGLYEGEIFKIDLMFDSEGAKTESKLTKSFQNDEHDNYDEYEEYNENNQNNQGAKKVGKLAKLFRRLKN